MDFIKKHIGDILIFFCVIAVFFLTGTPKKKSNDSIQSIESLIKQKNSEVVEQSVKTNSPPLPAPINNAPINSAPIPVPISQNNMPPAPEGQANNPYAVLMNRAGSNQVPDSPGIQNSLNNLKGEAPSTEALIERNTYFKKLSDQLKDLQGNVSTDEEKPENPNKNSKNAAEATDEDIDEAELADPTEPDLDEATTMPSAE